MISTKKLAYKIVTKISSMDSDIATAQSDIAKLGTVVVSTSSVSSLPVTISDSDILADHVCIKAELSNPSAQTADWTVTTSAGSAVISGTSAISGTTDVTLYLALKTN